MHDRPLNARIRRWKRRMEARGQSLDLVIVDYLQLLGPIIDPRSHRGVTEVSQDLRRIAKENDVGILALSQLSRKVEERQDKRPIISDLRESGQIEQDADLILFLYRQEYYLEQIEPRERGAQGRWRSAPNGSAPWSFAAARLNSSAPSAGRAGPARPMAASMAPSGRCADERADRAPDASRGE
jgi:replicative DNA helicase